MSTPYSLRIRRTPEVLFTVEPGGDLVIAGSSFPVGVSEFTSQQFYQMSRVVTLTREFSAGDNFTWNLYEGAATVNGSPLALADVQGNSNALQHVNVLVARMVAREEDSTPITDYGTYEAPPWTYDAVSYGTGRAGDTFLLFQDMSMLLGYNGDVWMTDARGYPLWPLGVDPGSTIYIDFTAEVTFQLLVAGKAN